ncbi:TLD-domain-containing protein [Stereum hirsutum FP-91666 SS1]|uniref:TLD-domain-containing protein n=1 Tax=Stereum hirsutum (strain FP-91666) TaxID=721885 RepID=UPI000444A6AB|nr:TLD-domain-containing protein [Stereum hirsutum FP-91666 SS1]EIM84600.1 TLD-domain-containing protein [Stereum hirsutum FP-91666 SS1]
MTAPLNSIPSLIPLPSNGAPVSTSKADDNLADDIFSTLFSPATPPASPRSSPTETNATSQRLTSKPDRPPIAHNHTRTWSNASSSSEFGSFVSVPPSDAPLQPSLSASHDDPLSTWNGLGSHSPSQIFFDQFTEEATAANERNKNGYLEELLRHEDDPLYWLTSNNENLNAGASISGTGGETPVRSLTPQQHAPTPLVSIPQPLVPLPPPSQSSSSSSSSLVPELSSTTFLVPGSEPPKPTPSPLSGFDRLSASLPTLPPPPSSSTSSLLHSRPVETKPPLTRHPSRLQNLTSPSPSSSTPTSARSNGSSSHTHTHTPGNPAAFNTPNTFINTTATSPPARSPSLPPSPTMTRSTLSPPRVSRTNSQTTFSIPGAFHDSHPHPYSHVHAHPQPDLHSESHSHSHPTSLSSTPPPLSSMPTTTATTATTGTLTPGGTNLTSSSRWMSSFLSTRTALANTLASAVTIVPPPSPPPGALPHHSNTYDSHSNTPHSRSRSISAHGTPYHASTLPLSTSLGASGMLGPPGKRETDITHGTPFGTQVYVPPSGAPGFNGNKGWNKGGFEFDEEGVERKRGVEKKSVLLLGRKESTEAVLTGDVADEIRPYLPALSRLPKSWTLLFSLDQHGISLQTLYSRCEAHVGGALVVIKDEGEAVFGVWMGEGIRKERGGYYGSGESFLWKVKDKNKPEVKVYKWTGKNDYVALCEPGYISFGGGDGHYGLYLDDTLYDGSSAPCPTFGNEALCTGGEKGGAKAGKGGTVEFVCVGLEVWGIGGMGS